MINKLIPKYCNSIPEKEFLTEGILYIVKNHIAIHLCACGCGLETVTPLSPENWKLIDNDGLITLRPSIGNTKSEAPKYHAHYFITGNKIIWC